MLELFYPLNTFIGMKLARGGVLSKLKCFGSGSDKKRITSLEEVLIKSPH